MNQSFAGMGGTTCTFITIVSAFGKISEKSNGRIKSYKAKSVILDDLGLFGGIFTPFVPLGTHQGFCTKKFLQCKITYENTICHKISENLMDGSLAISRTHARTDARTHARTGLITIVPFRLKSGD